MCTNNFTYIDNVYVGKRLIDRRKTNQLGSDLCECCEQEK